MRRICITIIAALSLLAGAANATIVRIPEDLGDIQLAIERSLDGDTILIARGRYYINLRIIGRELTIASRFLLTGDSADVPETIITGREGVGSVMTIEPWNHTVRVVGFTITQGRAQDGGGIHCQDGTMVVDNCVFSSDSARSGGGIYVRNSTLTLTNSTFEANRAINGGGVFCHSVNLVMSGCRVVRNRAFLGSGMLFEGDSAATIDSCDFSGSMALEDGGGEGIAINGMIEFPPVIIQNCNISNNIAEGVVINQRLVTMEDCRVFGNRRGGVSVLGDLTLLRCLLYSNITPRGGGGLRVDSFGRTALINCVVYGNEAQAGGGVYTEARDSLVMVNSILWGNRPTAYYGVPYILYCDITGGAPGDSNIRVDPRFVNPDLGDFRLRADSPCIDKGLDSLEWVGRTILDLDSSEFVGSRPDIGAFEFDPNGVEPEVPITPSTISLSAYPNPFNSSTTISFSLSSASASLSVYAMDGRLVADLTAQSKIQNPQSKIGKVVWDASGVGAGVYLVKLVAGGQGHLQKLVLIR